MSNSVFRNEFYRNTEQGITACVRNTDSVTNLNASTTFSTVSINGTVDRLDTGFQLSGQGIQVLETGWLNINAGAYLQCSENDIAVEFCVAVNGAPRPIIRSAKISATSCLFSHAELTDGFYAVKNDVILLFARKAGVAGTATMIVGGSSMKISRDPVVGVASLANDLFKQVSSQTYTNASNGTWVEIQPLGINCVPGMTYKIQFNIRYMSSATSSGIVLSLANNGGLTGKLTINARNNTTLTAGSLQSQTAFNTALTFTATPSTGVSYMAELTAYFVCMAAGVLMPRFRSEVNGRTITVNPLSFAEIREVFS